MINFHTNKRGRPRKKYRIEPTSEIIFKREKLKYFLKSMGAQVIPDDAFQCNLSLLQCLGWCEMNHVALGLQYKALQQKMTTFFELPVGKISDIYQGPKSKKSGDRQTTAQEAECKNLVRQQRLWREIQYFFMSKPPALRRIIGRIMDHNLLTIPELTLLKNNLPIGELVIFFEGLGDILVPSSSKMRGGIMQKL